MDGGRMHGKIHEAITVDTVARSTAETVGNVNSSSSTPTVAGASRPAAAIGSSAQSGPAKRPRKERGPNWTQLEVNALIEAKRLQTIHESQMVDGRKLMTIDAGKWNRISALVMKEGHSPYPRDGPACKSKWSQIYPDYKKIADFMARSGNNDESFWELPTSLRRAEGLPRSYPQDVFYQIHNWNCNRPSVMPPHSQDLLAVEDQEIDAPIPATGPLDETVDTDDEDDPIAVVAYIDLSAEGSASMQSPSVRVPSIGSRGNLAFAAARGNDVPASPCRGPAAAPPTPHIVLSAETSTDNARRRPANTGVRRKSLSGHSLIAEATRATGDIMATQMRDMAEASRDLERTRIQVQQKIFNDQMNYQKDRDLRLQENARQANENAKLAIDKQGQVVMCLAELTAALTTGFQGRNQHHTPGTSRTTAPVDPNSRASLDHDVHIKDQ